MKRPRIADFDPDAKVPSLKSPLDDMPPIVRVKKELSEVAATNELRGGSAFFPNYKRVESSPAEPHERQLSEPKGNAVRERGTPVPPPVPRPVPRTVPRPGGLVPKVHRPIRQRQPFDIYEDQYVKLKKIAEEEREFVNGRGMSHMVREAIDNYLKDHKTRTE
jgi:hypothetical protein